MVTGLSVAGTPMSVDEYADRFAKQRLTAKRHSERTELCRLDLVFRLLADPLDR
jgi:hypothetical protein